MPLLTLTTFLVIFLIIKYSKKNTFESDFLFFSFLFILLFYLLPGLIIGSSNSGSYNYLGKSYFISSEDLYFSGIGMIVFLFGFFFTNFTNSLVPKKKVNIKSKLRNKDYILRSNSVIFLITILLLFSSFIIFFTKDIDLTKMIRSGEIKGSYVKTLLLYSGIMLSVFLVAIYEKRNNKILQFFSILSLVFLSLVIGGRAYFLFAMILFLPLVKIPIKPTVIIFLFFFPIIIPIIIAGKSLLYELNSDFTFKLNIHLVYSLNSFLTNYYDALVANFGHPIISYINVDNLITLTGYRYFYDYLHGFLFYLKLLNINTGDSLTYFNTELLLGQRASIIPTGYLTFGYVQFNLLGVFFSGIFYRLLPSFFWKYLKDFSYKSDSYKIYFSILFAYSFYTGEVRTMILTIGWPLLCSILYIKIFFKK